MRLLRATKKISAVFLACTFALSSVISGMIVTADTMSELEAKQAKLEEELQNVESLLSEYEDKAEEVDKYLDEYDNKMKVQEEQVKVVEKQIEMYEEKLTELEADIEAKEAEFNEGIEQFRQRLRALYMAGNDSLASVIAGSSDFYDMLARMEFVERVSKHDNDLIDSLNTQITELEATKAEYEATLEQLEIKKAEEEAYYEELRETWNGHAETKQMHENMIADYEARADEIADEKAEVEEELQAEIRRLQEEAERKRKEEEERRRKEEERKKQEAEARQQLRHIRKQALSGLFQQYATPLICTVNAGLLRNKAATSTRELILQSPAVQAKPLLLLRQVRLFRQVTRATVTASA